MHKFSLPLWHSVLVLVATLGVVLAACAPRPVTNLSMIGKDSASLIGTVESPKCLDGLAIHVTSNPSAIVYGQSSVVSWSVDLPSGCGSMSVQLNGRPVAQRGSQTVTPTRSTTYSVTVFFNIKGVPGEETSSARVTVSYQRYCPPDPKPHIVEIREANPQVDKQHHDLMRRMLTESITIPNTTILLGPNVVLDFSDVSDSLPLSFGPCVTLTSASAFGPDTSTPHASGSITKGGSLATVPSTIAQPESSAPQSTSAVGPNQGDSIFDGRQQPARTPHSLGPLLKFDPQFHRRITMVFLLINCDDPGIQPEYIQPSDNVRISGFRLFGGDFGQQRTNDIGIQVKRCLNIEISNMEIAGWGGQAIQVLDEGDDENQPANGPGQEQPNNLHGERIGRPEQVRIFHNYIHHNQHPRTLEDSHALGYGVDVHHGAWAQVYENVFDFNRHAIAAAGDTGGYEALRNLVLKGGGIHFETFNIHTHQFDIHGDSDNNGFGGQAGVQFEFANNSFQYLAGPAMEIRGRPQVRIDIHDNAFAHEELDDAIHVNDTNDLDVIKIGPNNTGDFDSYGRYGVCDFDGDGIDDLFLATGKTWWYSSSGKFQWTYLSARTERLDQVRLGYFDDDLRCDVLTESSAEWVIASGGTGPRQSIGAFDAPLNEVAFGQFDPSQRDHRPGVTRRTMHAFWRKPSGEWLITPLSAPAWHHVGSSSFPMSDLRFGDFTGDGVTDVLAVEDGRWAISESALFPWRRLNPDLSDDVSSLFIADLNNNNIDDLIRLERTELRTVGNIVIEIFTWWVSDDGRSPWRKLKTYEFLKPISASIPVFAFAGRFGAAPGGDVLLIDHNRIGHFYSEAEIAAGASPDWTSPFPY